MFDVRKSWVLGSAMLRDSSLRARPILSKGGKAAFLAAPLATVLVVAGCSWFSDEPAPPADEQAKASVPAPGEGEAMNGTQTAEATTPDINSVPTEAPKPSIVNLDQAQEGLGGDSGNSQHTDETLMMPNQSAERPGPAPSETPQTAQNEPSQPTAPETPAAPPAVDESAATPAPAPTPAPAVEPTPAPAPVQVATAGTPQPGSKPFEPSGPLHLAPGSLARNTQEAATPAVGQASLPSASPAPSSAPSSDSVSVDYSVLGGLQGGPSSSYEAAVAASSMPSSGMPAGTPTTAPYGGNQVAGVGQAVGYVYFGNGSANLSAADRQVLQQVVQLQRIQGGVLRIVGHASARTGNIEALEQEQINREVSLQRATAVARALVNMGVQPMLVQVAAAGDNQTLYAESTPAGEAGNRRAEVYLSQN